MNEILDKRPVKYILIFLIVFLAIYVFYSLPTVLDRKEETDIKFLQCPYSGNFTDYWNAWSYEYLTKYPQSDVSMQMDAWNAWVAERGCDEKWLNPLDDVIEQHGASGTPVYWYDSTQ